MSKRDWFLVVGYTVLACVALAMWRKRYPPRIDLKFDPLAVDEDVYPVRPREDPSAFEVQQFRQEVDRVIRERLLRERNGRG